MKKIIAMLFAAVMFTACNNDEGRDDQLDGTAVFTGSLTVTYQGNDIVTDNVRVEVDFDDDGKNADICFYGVKFVPQMPVSIDVEIPDVPYVMSGDDKYTFNADGIVPVSGEAEVPFPQYTVNGLKGVLGNANLELSLSFGDFPTKYSGTVIFTD